MRTITCCRLLAMGLVPLLAAGCQTTHPTPPIISAPPQALMPESPPNINMNGFDAVEITNKGVELFYRQEYSLAAQYLSEAARRFPSYQPALCYLGACQACLGSREEAMHTLTKAIQINPHTQESTQAGKWLEWLRGGL